MSKAYFRLIRKKTKNFFSLTFEIITGNEKISPEEIRKRNIEFLYKTTIYWFPWIEQLYNECYNEFNSNNDLVMSVIHYKLKEAYDGKAIN